jgi:hypothetical protein
LAPGGIGPGVCRRLLGDGPPDAQELDIVGHDLHALPLCAALSVLPPVDVHAPLDQDERARGEEVGARLAGWAPDLDVVDVRRVRALLAGLVARVPVDRDVEKAKRLLAVNGLEAQLGRLGQVSDERAAVEVGHGLILVFGLLPGRA